MSVVQIDSGASTGTLILRCVTLLKPAGGRRPDRTSDGGKGSGMIPSLREGHYEVWVERSEGSLLVDVKMERADDLVV